MYAAGCRAPWCRQQQHQNTGARLTACAEGWALCSGGSVPTYSFKIMILNAERIFCYCFFSSKANKEVHLLPLGSWYGTRLTHICWTNQQHHSAGKNYTNVEIATFPAYGYYVTYSWSYDTLVTTFWKSGLYKSNLSEIFHMLQTLE